MQLRSWLMAFRERARCRMLLWQTRSTSEGAEVAETAEATAVLWSLPLLQLALPVPSATAPEKHTRALPVLHVLAPVVASAPLDDTDGQAARHMSMRSCAWE